MKGDKEVIGTLRGFDEFVNMVLEDVTEMYRMPSNAALAPHVVFFCRSDFLWTLSVPHRFLAAVTHYQRDHP